MLAATMIIVSTRRLLDGSCVYLLLYVDDMLIIAKSMSEINNLKAQLRNEFEIKDLGTAEKFWYGG